MSLYDISMLITSMVEVSAIVWSVNCKIIIDYNSKSYNNIVICCMCTSTIYILYYGSYCGICSYIMNSN